MTPRRTAETAPVTPEQVQPDTTTPVDPDSYVHLGGDVWAHPALEALLVPIDQITPHPDNPRMGDVDEIAASVSVNRVYKPLVVQRSTGRILAGNHTYEAIMAGGAQQAPIVALEVDDAGAHRIMLADNRTADLGRYDNTLLAQIIEAVRESEAGLLGSGYDDDAADEVVAAIRRANHIEIGKFGQAGNLNGVDKDADDKGRFTKTLADNHSIYADKSVRYVMVEYPLDVYVLIIEALGEHRANLGLESNADVIQHLLGVPRQQGQGEPAEPAAEPADPSAAAEAAQAEVDQTTAAAQEAAIGARG